MRYWPPALKPGYGGEVVRAKPSAPTLPVSISSQVSSVEPLVWVIVSFLKKYTVVAGVEARADRDHHLRRLAQLGAAEVELEASCRRRRPSRSPARPTVGSVVSDTVTPSGSEPGAICTMVPSVVWTMPPVAADRRRADLAGWTTLTGTTVSAGPLMIVTVVSPTPAEVARPSAREGHDRGVGDDVERAGRRGARGRSSPALTRNWRWPPTSGRVSAPGIDGQAVGAQVERVGRACRP